MAEVIERGDVYFLYRPKVGLSRARGPGDVDRAYMILHPYDQATYRLIALGSNRLPGEGVERAAAFVDRTASRASELLREFREAPSPAGAEHDLPPARPAGEGVYALIRDGDFTHLAYALELPTSAGPVQEGLGIREQHVLTLSMKSPARPPSNQPGLEGREVDLPRDLADLFEDHPFIPVDPPRLLDHEAAELLLVRTEVRAAEDLGIDLDPEREWADSAEFFLDLGMSRREHPVEPLFTGEWR